MGCYYADLNQRTNPINILPVAQKRVKIELAIDVIHQSAMNIIRLHGHSDYRHRNKSPANPRNIQPNIREWAEPGCKIKFRVCFYPVG